MRTPRCRVLADGVAVAGVESVDVHANSHLAADRFRVRLAAQVVDVAALSRAGVRLDVQMGFGGGWASLVLGTADAIQVDPLRGTVDLEGRDLSAGLIETQVGETFANRTASEVATVIAGRHGLVADVTRTGTAVGRYYQGEHDRLTLAQFAKATTEWDLLGFLAAQEGFQLFVSGARLRFGPSVADGAVVLRVTDCLSLELEHSVGLSRAIAVTVRSWGTRQGTMVEHTARAEGEGVARTQTLVRPNLDAEQARALAERVVADLRRHERTVHATVPGELSITPRSQVVLAGAGPGWDRAFAVAEVSRHLDVRRGFTQRLRLVGV